ncbi:hypothetical protein EDD29_2055 [Actinocorallia herbida]|uniref:Uncharacterized protein n=1 Tax=Actinocorallia herbida TaxID=58109 RepID=A0A3N1CUZ7_9ACTN|nr:hypothetical protein [Actinocorallia herbida]ROO84528.1 hypothetical protein EDD29_2055 [Actinocorallia herbida]
MEQPPPPGAIAFPKARDSGFQGAPVAATGTCWWPPQQYSLPAENPTLRHLFDTPVAPKGKRHRPEPHSR